MLIEKSWWRSVILWAQVVYVEEEGQDLDEEERRQGMKKIKVRLHRHVRVGFWLGARLLPSVGLASVLRKAAMFGQPRLFASVCVATNLDTFR